MRKSTALILKGFIESMKSDGVGWHGETIGQVVYEIYRLIENSSDIPEDKEKKK